MSTSSFKDRAVRRRVLIAAAIWAALPAAVVAICILTSVLASAGLVPETLAPPVLLTVLLVVIVWLLIPFRTPQIPPQRYFDRYSVSDKEKKVDMGLLIAVFVTLAGVCSGAFSVYSHRNTWIRR